MVAVWSPSLKEKRKCKVQQDNIWLWASFYPLRKKWSYDMSHGSSFCYYVHNIVKLCDLLQSVMVVYHIYSILDECCSIFLPGVCKIFEEHLKRTNPNSPSITYDISQLFDFIDSLRDLVCLM